MTFFARTRGLLLAFVLLAVGHISYLTPRASGAAPPQGEQRLTQEVFDNFVFYWESLLDLKFTAEEREALKRGLIAYWQTNNTTAIHNILEQAGFAERNRDEEGILTSTREAYQASSLAQLRKATDDPVAVALLRAFDRAHGFGGGGDGGGAAGAVLAPGNPPLTQEMVDKFLGLYEFILDLKFSAEQRNRLLGVMTEAWRKNDRHVIDRVVGDVQFVNRRRTKEEAKRALGEDYQVTLVSGMRRSLPDPLISPLIEAFDEAHPDRREATRAKGFADLVGTWEWHDALNQQRDAYSGALRGVGYVDGGQLVITPDGQFKLLRTHRHCEGACCREQGKSESGTVSVERGELVFQIKSGMEVSRDGCNAGPDRQSAISPHRESYGDWNIYRNPVHDNALTLCWNTAPNESTCYVKQQ